MNSYPVPEYTLSPYCMGIWDANRKKFFDTNSVNVIDCCIELCRRHIDYCYDQCEKKYGVNGETPDSFQNTRCYKQCGILTNTCKSGCLENKSTGLEIVKNCSESCKEDAECLERNKDTIISCCKKNCISNQSTDCTEDNCNLFFDHYSDSKKFPLSKMEDKHKLTKGDGNRRDSKVILYVILCFVFLLSLFMAYKMLVNNS